MCVWCGISSRPAFLSALFAAGIILGSALAVPAAEIPPPPIDEVADTATRAGKADAANEAGRGRTVMVLGVSWQPGFCEFKPKSAECRDQSAERLDARQFSLNGLWRVRKTYCGVSEALKAQDKGKKWTELPELVLGETLKVELARAMPGTASGLDRHEWVKHGTCSGDLAEGYYTRSLALLAALNGSAVGTLFADRIGETLSETEVKAAFNQAFGAGAGDRVKMRCRKDGERRVITGLTIGLGEVADGDDFGRMVLAAGPTKFGCAEGVVDEAGAQ